MEGLRVVGDPAAFAKRYSDAGADEIVYIDTVATLYGRNQLEGLLAQTAGETMVPITVGGGIKSSDDCKRLLDSGADKLALNTAAIRLPETIGDIAARYGCQAIVVSIETKRTAQGWEAYTDNGREKTGRNALQWAHEAIARGAGELLITSIDQEGTRQGLDIAFLDALGWVAVPVVVSGGCGSIDHVRQAFEHGADGVAVAHCLHYGLFSIDQARAELGLN